MDLAESPEITIVIANYNGLEHLQSCLPSLAGQHYTNYKVLIVDNASTDGSLEFTQANYPDYQIVRNSSNLGYAGACNVGFQLARSEYIAVLNQDTRVDPDWLSGLVSVLKSHPKAGLATPKILLFDRPERINTCGNEITMSGLTFCRGLDESCDRYPNIESISAVSGAAFMIRRSVLEEISGFDERLFMYYEETDLSLRALLAGYELYYVPDSIVYHKYAFRYSPLKAFYLERNRYIALLKTLRWETLLVMLPSLVIAEIIAWGYACLNGWGHILSKFKTYTWLVSHFPQVISSRQQVQKLRRVSDQEILKRFGLRLNFTQTTSPSMAKILDVLINPFLVFFGTAGRILVTW